MTEKLLSCPFCGGEASVMQYREPVVNGWVGCPECRCFIDWVKAGKSLAITAWNRRAQPENKPLTLDELREMGEEPQPVYLVSEKYTEGNGWKVCYGVTDHEFINFGDEAWAAQVFDGHHVIAYRHKPKEVQGYEAG